MNPPPVCHCLARSFAVDDLQAQHDIVMLKHGCTDALTMLDKKGYNLRNTLLMCFPGVIALLMSDLPFYTDPVKYPNTYLSSPLLPVFLSLLIGYVVASVFFNVRVH
jgi:hypothetical protein